MGVGWGGGGQWGGGVSGGGGGGQSMSRNWMPRTRDRTLFTKDC